MRPLYPNRPARRARQCKRDRGDGRTTIAMPPEKIPLGTRSIGCSGDRERSKGGIPHVIFALLDEYQFDISAGHQRDGRAASRSVAQAIAQPL
jgi:hypothetical protein